MHGLEIFKQLGGDLLNFYFPNTSDDVSVKIAVLEDSKYSIAKIAVSVVSRHSRHVTRTSWSRDLLWG